MTDINWNALYAFWLVAENHSFAAASRVLQHGSPQALHKRVRTLEDDLKLRLLRSRGTKGLELTEGGRRVYELVSPIFRDIDRLTTELRGEDSGPLHVAASNFSAHDFVPDILSVFCPKFPNVSVHLHMREPQDVVALAESGRVDFGICAFLTRLEKCEVKAETPLPLAILVPKGHRFRNGIPSWKELLREPLILPEPGTLIRSIFDELVNRQKLSGRLHVNAELSSTPDISAGAVRAGLGVALVARGRYTGMNCRGVLQVDPPPGLRQVRLSVICQKGRYLPKYMHSFLEAAAGVMRQDPRTSDSSGKES
jgi:DNA-binding transcriptional LysR family regulator